MSVSRERQSQMLLETASLGQADGSTGQIGKDSRHGSPIELCVRTESAKRTSERRTAA